MGKKLIPVEGAMGWTFAFTVALGSGASACATQAEAPHARFRFESQFSESGIFDCLSGRQKIDLGLGSSGGKAPADMSPTDKAKILGIEIETYPTKKTNHIDYLWGLATFDDGDKKVTVPLNNGQTAHFERFGPTPNWPFKSKKDSQLFFTFRLNEGPLYKCKAVYQPDQ